MQIAETLAAQIKQFGGEILTKAKVISSEEKDGALTALVLSNGEKIETKNVVSNVHPLELMKIVDKVSFIRAAQKRMRAARFKDQDRVARFKSFVRKRVYRIDAFLNVLSLKAICFLQYNRKKQTDFFISLFFVIKDFQSSIT